MLPQSDQPRELASGVDALYLSGRGELPGQLLASLDALRIAATDAGTPIDWQLGGYPVRILRNAWGKYRYCAVHELARFGFTPSESLPAVRIQPTSIALHALGPEGTVLWARNVLDAAGIDAVLQVSRLDLHADWQAFAIDAGERSHFVTYSNKRALYEVDEALSGLNFGTRGAAIYARIYDKTRELEGKADDWWREAWGTAYDPDEPVIRVEFEFTRDGLREFGVDTPEDAFDQLGPLWAYASGNLLTLRQPTADETRSRWPIDPRWLAIQRATLAGTALPAARIRADQHAGSLRRMLPQLVGYLTGAAAHLGTTDLPDTCQALAPYVSAYERQSGLTFTERVHEKRLRP